MEYDNICKLLCKKFPDSIARWVIKDLTLPVTVWDKELSIEPIHADSVIFLETEDRILHIEFQVDPGKSLPALSLRMLDYWVRLTRLHQKPVEQIVFLLKNTPAARELKSEYDFGPIRYRFQIVRLWEEAPESFFEDMALIPFASLAKTDEPVKLLNKVAEQIKKIDNIDERKLISASTQILAGLHHKADIIHRIFKEGVMRESVIYQEIHQDGVHEGMQEGIKKGRLEGIHEGMQKGMQKGRQEGMQKGMQKGMQEGELFFINSYLRRKFGDLETELHKQLQGLSVAQLEELVNVLFDFESIDELKVWLQIISH